MSNGLTIKKEEKFDRLCAEGWKTWSRPVALFYFVLGSALFTYSFLDLRPPLMFLGLALLFPWCAALSYSLFAVKVRESWECEPEVFRWQGGALPRDSSWNWSDFEEFVTNEDGVHGKLRQGGFLVMGRYLSDESRRSLLAELKKRHAAAAAQPSELRTVDCPGCGQPRVNVADCCEPTGLLALIAIEIGHITGYWIKSIRRKPNPHC